VGGEIAWATQLVQSLDPNTPYLFLIMPIVVILYQQNQLKQLQSETEVACEKVKLLCIEFECFKDKVLPRINKINDKELKKIVEKYIENVNRIKG
jgi:chemotaxis protein CheY-P-specific phosphatase CheC